MNDMRPEIHELSDCVTNADRARACPLVEAALVAAKCEHQIAWQEAAE